MLTFPARFITSLLTSDVAQTRLWTPLFAGWSVSCIRDLAVIRPRVIIQDNAARQSIGSFLMLALIGMGGPWELAIIAFIALLLFGKKLPGAMRSVGQSITEFKKGMNEVPKDSPDHLESSDNA